MISKVRGHVILKGWPAGFLNTISMAFWWKWLLWGGCSHQNSIYHKNFIFRLDVWQILKEISESTGGLFIWGRAGVIFQNLPSITYNVMTGRLSTYRHCMGCIHYRYRCCWYHCTCKMTQIITAVNNMWEVILKYVQHPP